MELAYFIKNKPIMFIDSKRGWDKTQLNSKKRNSVDTGFLFCFRFKIIDYSANN